MIDELAKRFRDKNKKVDLNLMLEKYLELFPNTALPLPKESKKHTPLSKRSKTLTGNRKDKKAPSAQRGNSNVRNSTNREIERKDTETSPPLEENVRKDQNDDTNADNTFIEAEAVGNGEDDINYEDLPNITNETNVEQKQQTRTNHLMLDIKCFVWNRNACN